MSCLARQIPDFSFSPFFFSLEILKALVILIELFHGIRFASKINWLSSIEMTGWPTDRKMESNV